MINHLKSMTVTPWIQGWQRCVGLCTSSATRPPGIRDGFPASVGLQRLLENWKAMKEIAIIYVEHL
jgi:hypothetical protein